MSLMSGLYVGVSGLQTSQNALNTTAHNVTNSENEGYVRQQVMQATNVYNTIKTTQYGVSDQQIGLGVVYARTRQVRDVFLDATYRKEYGRQAFYEVGSDALGEIENLLDEMNGETFQLSINSLWESVQELAKDPSSAVTQGLFVERCSEFLARGKAVYQGLTNYQSTLNDQVKSNVYDINAYASRIKELNDQIRNIEVGGFEVANDLRDERNLLLDKLSALANISYTEDADFSVTVQLEGEDLVRGEIAYQLGCQMDGNTGFYNVFWIKNASATYNEYGEAVYSTEEVLKAKVFDLDRIISSDIDTDIGKLKSTLLARGDHKADYTDLSEEKYTNRVSQSVCMNVMAEFDQLVHNIATKINEVLATAANEAKAINPSTNYLRDSKGNPIQVFQKIASNGYDTLGNLIAEDPSVNESLYTTGNLMINVDLLQQPTRLGFVLPDGSVDFDTMEKIKAAFTVEESVLNINVKKKSNFIDYYSDLVNQVANSGFMYNAKLESQQHTVNSAFNAREQVIGVSTDEEMTFMIKFQNAYNASSRYINVVNEMLEHIINTLGS